MNPTCSALSFEQSALQTEGRGLQSTLLTATLAAFFSLCRDVPGDISNDFLGKKQQPECKERTGKGEGQYIKEREEEMCADNNQPTIPCWIFPAQNSMAQYDPLYLNDPELK